MLAAMKSAVPSLTTQPCSLNQEKSAIDSVDDYGQAWSGSVVFRLPGLARVAPPDNGTTPGAGLQAATRATTPSTLIHKRPDILTLDREIPFSTRLQCRRIRLAGTSRSMFLFRS
jgi:hypothetical protein